MLRTQRRGKSYSTSLLELVELYISAGGATPVSPRAVAKWAIENGKWDRHRPTVITMCARDISRALREDYYIDTKGRTVRARHSVRIIKEDETGKRRQLTLWHDHREMPRGFAERSFKQRRMQIVGDCNQLKTDVDSYNDRHQDEKPIQLILDFTYDVAEGELGETWTPPRYAK